MRGEDANPEKIKDFDRAYKSLGGKLDKKGASSIIPDMDKPDLYRYQDVSVRDHIRREELFQKLKNNNLAYMQHEQAEKELEGCTFEPDTYNSKRIGEIEEGPRHFYEFLDHKQRFLEHKNLKALEMMHDELDREMDEVRDGPQIDDLSNQLVGMMNERRNEPAHQRLYKHG